MKYPIVIHKEKNSDYGVSIPDLPGCFSAGSTIEESIEMALEAAECHVEGLLLDNEPIPVPQLVEKHQENKDYKNGTWAIIEVDLGKLSVKSKRINVTIPERLLNVVDNYAKKHGESRSGLLAQAVNEYMVTHS